MRVLLTGGAGYIGSHVAVALVEAGHVPLVVDSLANSHQGVIPRVEALTGGSVAFLRADVRDEPRVLDFVTSHGPVDAVVHLAGLKSVAESTADPLHYYDVNVGSTTALLRTMQASGVKTLVFSSSATVYGDPERLPITEKSPTTLDLASPYGKTKRMIEEIISDIADSDSTFSAISLRYFNPIGAHPSGLLGEEPVGPPNNLMPIILRAAAGLIDHLSVYGTDYDTADGSGVRDYIHVQDLARGHVRALEHARTGHTAYNLGTGTPVSVLELIHAFEAATGRAVPVRFERRRAGDVAVSYADPTKAAMELNWRSELSLETACADAWRWFESQKRSA